MEKKIQRTLIIIIIYFQRFNCQCISEFIYLKVCIYLYIYDGYYVTRFKYTIEISFLQSQFRCINFYIANNYNLTSYFSFIFCRFNKFNKIQQTQERKICLNKIQICKTNFEIIYISKCKFIGTLIVSSKPEAFK